MVDAMTPNAETNGAAESTVPVSGEERRNWIQHELKKHTNRETSRGYTQADIARAAAASESTVSQVFSGTRTDGEVVQRVKRETAKVLRMKITDLFGHICTECPKCGTTHQPKQIPPGALVPAT